MGALHEGHGALLDAARKNCAIVVASVFVNPLQFNDGGDYALYPRVEDDDHRFCADHGTDFVFVPEDSELYPSKQRAFVDVAEISDHLCGRTRPGHFRGVATVVIKLFDIVQPKFVYFGEKDYQQLALVRALVRDLNEVVGVETVREQDGLAKSSRNRRLGADERRAAPLLYQALQDARQLVALGERDAKTIRGVAGRVLEGIRLEYFELVDPDTIRPVHVVEKPVRAALAAWLGNVRLIDNVLCSPPNK
jgi:pantoate--beta-alanine ligase